MSVSIYWHLSPLLLILGIASGGKSYFENLEETPKSCVASVPCHQLAQPLRTIKALLNELEFVNRIHCQPPSGYPEAFFGSKQPTYGPDIKPVSSLSENQNYFLPSMPSNQRVSIPVQNQGNLISGFNSRLPFYMPLSHHKQFPSSYPFNVPSRSDYIDSLKFFPINNIVEETSSRNKSSVNAFDVDGCAKKRKKKKKPCSKKTNRNRKRISLTRRFLTSNVKEEPRTDMTAVLPKEETIELTTPVWKTENVTQFMDNEA